MRFSRSIVILLCISFGSVAFSASTDWDDSETGSLEQISAAIAKLPKNPSTADAANLNEFAQGVLSFHQGHFDQAITHFQNNIRDDKFILSEYAHYFLGLSFEKNNQLPEAYKEFEKIAQNKKAGVQLVSAKFRLGEVALAQKNYRLAELHLRSLQRKVRATDRYAFVLWDLARASIAERNIYQACKYVRKLYTKFPAHPLVANWDLDLKNADVDGYKPGCMASLKDQKSRIKSLQYAGEAERAKKEILALYQRTNAFTKYDVDVIYARFLIDEGEVDEALKLLLPYYNDRAYDIAYLMLIAKAASIRGDSSIGIAAYLRVAQMKPRSSVGREAFYQAAFVSYLSEDYDGALQRFDEYRQRYGGKNGQIAQWYVAWIRYLKGDYKGAYDMMNKFARTRFSRRVRQQVFDPQKIAYWKAVCLLKMGEVDVAKKQLEKIAQDPSVGYYAIVAKARLTAAQPIFNQRKMSSLDEKNSKAIEKNEKPSPESIISATPPPQPDAAPANENATESEAEIISDTKTETDSVAEESDDNSTDEESDDKTDEDSASADNTPESPADNLFSNLKDPSLLAIFQRAGVLGQLGFDDWANKELQFIESHTRNKSYLQSLMDKYEIGSVYSRSAYIAEIYYEGERRKNFSNNNPGWKKAYPEAFDKLISKYSGSYGIPESLLWGIMRTESFFKPYAHSNVGALGLMQVMPLTAEKMAEQLSITNFHSSQLFDPETNVKIGGKYIQRLSKMFDGYVPLIAAGYNAGPHRVFSWLKNFGRLSMDEFIEHIPYNQTRGYAKKVLRGYYVYNSLYFPDQMKKKSIDWLAEPPKITYTGPVLTKESWDP